jgi:hypothetical protein
MKNGVLETGLICGILFLFLGMGVSESDAIISSCKSPYDGPVEVIDQQQTKDSGYGFNFYENIWLAQGFTPTLATLTKIELYLFRAGDVPENTIITIYIRPSLTGNNLATVTNDGSDIFSFASWIEFNFSDIEVIPGNTYYIICQANAGSSHNTFCWMFADDNPYAGGAGWWSTDYGSSWSLLDQEGHRNTDCCFKTYGLDLAPTIPVVTGPSSGKVGEPTTYTFVSTDPEGQDVFYMVDWGDGQISNWTDANPSGDSTSLPHTWDKRGTYTIKVKAKDSYNAESDWGTLKIKMPASFNLPLQRLCGRILDRHPNVFPILRHLLSLP